MHSTIICTRFDIQHFIEVTKLPQITVVVLLSPAWMNVMVS